MKSLYVNRLKMFVCVGMLFVSVVSEVVLQATTNELNAIQQEALLQLGKCFEGAVWRTELAGKDTVLKRYATELTNFGPTDLNVAGQIISMLQGTELWSKFVERKDQESAADVGGLVMYTLRKLVWEDCTLVFPSQLADIMLDMKASGLQEKEYIARLRRSLLVFLIMVSSMDAVEKGL